MAKVPFLVMAIKGSPVKCGVVKKTFCARSGVGVIPAAIAAIVPICNSGMSASKDILAKLIFLLSRRATSVITSISNPTIWSFSIKLKGGNSALVPITRELMGAVGDVCGTCLNHIIPVVIIRIIAIIISDRFVMKNL